jgi:signal peptidase
MIVRGSRPASARVRRAWYDSPWRIAGHALSTTCTVALVALVLALAVVPRLAGGASLTVLTGSMEPTLRPGDVVVTRGVTPHEVCTEVAVGTIVTFLPRPDDPALITHRVVGKTIGTFDDGTGCRLITQGDNNSARDEPVSPEQVRGVFLYGLPTVGWARQWVGDHLPVVGVALAVAVLGYGLWSGSRRPRTRVLSVPGIAGGTPPGVHPEPAASAATERDRELRERELLLRERELAVRERELTLRSAGTPDPSTPVTSEA